jgi:hypothetical protein
MSAVGANRLPLDDKSGIIRHADGASCKHSIALKYPLHLREKSEVSFVQDVDKKQIGSMIGLGGLKCSENNCTILYNTHNALTDVEGENK